MKEDAPLEPKKVDGVIDAEAFVRELYSRHGKYVQTLVMRLLGPGIDPQDLTQEVFMVAFRKPQALHSPRMWLTSIAFALAANFRKSRWYRDFVAMRESSPKPVIDELDWRTPEVEAEGREALAELYRLLERLPEKKRTVYIAAEIHGMTCVEIASTLDCSVNTVYSRLASARVEVLRLQKKYGGPHGR